MFIVKKKIRSNEYYYLRKSERENDKIRAVTVAYLGKRKRDAQKKAKEIIEKLRDKKERDKKAVMKNKKMIEEVEEKKAEKLTIDELTAFCKRKGFVFRSSDIYGGFSGFWDFGPLGVELFNNIKEAWWGNFVRRRDDIVGIEASVISNPIIWKASGHLDNFSDVAVVCKNCKYATKIDKSELESGNLKCEKCDGEYKDQGEFNLLFKTNVGALSAEDAYLRGETAQGMFSDFKLVYETSRLKLPFGIAQIGRCFRNEIAPRDFLFRSREFHIAEFEYFIHPEDEGRKCDLLEKKHIDLKIRFLSAEAQQAKREELEEVTIGEIIKRKKLDEWHGYWLAEQILWYCSLALDKNKIKIREHTKDELSHYSKATFDVDYEFPFGSKELGGNANRGQFDLMQHMKESKQNLEIFDEKTGKKVIPRVIEPTFGVERVFLALLAEAYNYDFKRDNVVLKINPRLAPIKAAVFPVVKNNKNIVALAREVYNNLRNEWNTMYDSGGSIGRRYSRQDEIGTPATITIDEQSLKDNTVTLRDRDTTEQIRIKIKDLKLVLSGIFNCEDFLKLGKRVKTRKKQAGKDL